MAGLAIAGVVVRREFSPPASSYAPRRDRAPEVVPSRDWRAIQDAAVWIGSKDAPVLLAEFADLECPACRYFHAQLKGLRDEFGQELAWLFIHNPLSMHKFAPGAARALECAHVQGRFEAFVDAAYQKQDSMGLRRWLDYARDAAVPDTTRFGECADRKDSVPRLVEHSRLVQKLNVTHTPALFINGMRYWSTPDSAEFRRIYRDAIAQRTAGGSR